MILHLFSFLTMENSLTTLKSSENISSFQTIILQVERKAGITGRDSWHPPGATVNTNTPNVIVSLPSYADFASTGDKLRYSYCYMFQLLADGALLSFPGLQACLKHAVKAPSLPSLPSPLASLPSSHPEAWSLLWSRVHIMYMTPFNRKINSR